MNKNGILVLALSSLLLISCGNEKNNQDNSTTSEKESVSISEAVNAVGSLKEMANQADNMEALRKKLSKKKPASNETIKAFLPETLLGIKRSKYSISKSPMFQGLLNGKANYRKDGDHGITLSIVDGAGKAGSSLVILAIWGLRADFEEETNTGFTKTIKIEGHRVKVEQEKRGQGLSSSLKFAINKRFLVTLEGDNFTVDELKEAYKELDFEALKSI